MLKSVSIWLISITGYTNYPYIGGSGQSILILYDDFGIQQLWFPGLEMLNLTYILLHPSFMPPQQTLLFIIQTLRMGLRAISSKSLRMMVTQSAHEPANTVGWD